MFSNSTLHLVLIRSLTLWERVTHTRHHSFKAKTFMKAPFTFLVSKLITGTTLCPNVCRTPSMTGPQYATLVVKECTDCTLSVVRCLSEGALIYRDTHIRRIFMDFTFLATDFSNMQPSSPNPALSSLNTWHQLGCSFRKGSRWDHGVIQGWKIPLRSAEL